MAPGRGLWRPVSGSPGLHAHMPLPLLTVLYYGRAMRPPRAHSREASSKPPHVGWSWRPGHTRHPPLLSAFWDLHSGYILPRKRVPLSLARFSSSTRPPLCRQSPTGLPSQPPPPQTEICACHHTLPGFRSRKVGSRHSVSRANDIRNQQVDPMTVLPKAAKTTTKKTKAASSPVCLVLTQNGTQEKTACD